MSFVPRERKGLLEALRRRPWLWPILGLGFFLLLDLVFLLVALAHPPILLR